MDNIFYLGNQKRSIDGKDFYRIFILDLKNFQIFSFYKPVDTKVTAFLANRKLFENVSSLLTFAIKRNNKISFDIK